MTTPAPCACAHAAAPCGCCAGIGDNPPAPIDNRPGLAAISYRPATWAQFKSSMLAELSKTPTLAGLRTRSDDDFTIALLDAWAVLCDILTFYQERIANEAYLRTATELVSVGELAKLIGYKLRPGLAAAAPLAFSLAAPQATPPGPNTPPSGMPSSVSVPVGTQAQTVPDPGAQPATFETVAAISARAEWNAIKVRQHLPVAAVKHNAHANIRLVGLTSTVKVGDILLVAVADADKTMRLNRVAAVTPDTATKTTIVAFEDDRHQHATELPSGPAPVLPATAALDDAFVWQYVKGQAWDDQTQLTAYATTQGWSIDTLQSAINALRGSLPPGATPPISVYAMGTDAAVFGHNAPNYNTLPDHTRQVLSDWEGDSLASNDSVGLPWIDLDNVYPVTVGDQVALLSYVVPFEFTPRVFGGLVVEERMMSTPGAQASVVGTGPSLIGFDTGSWQTFFTRVTDVQVVTRSAYLLASKVTSIKVDPAPDPSLTFGVRDTRVLVETPPALSPADVVTHQPVHGGQVMLDAAYLSLVVGQQVAVTGIRADGAGVTASEVVKIAGLKLIDGYTVLTFESQLTGSYVLSTVTVNANVAPATHGVTTTQILGSGDASQAFQCFALSQTPLTYVSAATTSGAASTLAVTVDGATWTQVDWLYEARPTDRVYTVLTGADGKTYVEFGDGVTGARPGSGTNNIVATYRYGIGVAGLARQGQISTLLSRSFGLNAVTNPGASTGAADPETTAQARANAPTSVMTLGRIVSLDDVADFAAASAGIAKAAVNWIWDGVRFVACATVAGVGGSPVIPGSPQYTNLLAAMLDASDGTLPLALCSYQAMTFGVGAAVTPDPTLDPAQVLAAVKSALGTAFSFDNRAFGQPVFSSEVIEVVQNVPGVIAVTLTALHYSGTSSATPAPALPAPAPTLGPQGLLGAVLLTLEPGMLPGVVIAS
jgi:hypothetical protein